MLSDEWSLWLGLWRCPPTCPRGHSSITTPGSAIIRQCSDSGDCLRWLRWRQRRRKMRSRVWRSRLWSKLGIFLLLCPRLLWRNWGTLLLRHVYWLQTCRRYHNNNNPSINCCVTLEHVLRDKNTFLRLHTFDFVWSKQQVLVGNRRLISDQLAVSSKSSLMWYRLSVLVYCL